MLQSTGWHRVGYDWVTELNWRGYLLALHTWGTREWWWLLGGRVHPIHLPIDKNYPTDVLKTFMYLCMHAQLLSCIQLSITPWTDPMGSLWSPTGSSVHGIFQARNTGVGCHFLLQGIFPTRTFASCLSWIVRWILYHWATWEIYISLRRWKRPFKE